MNVETWAGVTGRRLAVGFGLGLALVASAATPPRPDNGLLADGPAMLRDWAPPVYPAEARRDKIGGSVVVRIIVDPSGRVTSTRVITSVDPRLDAAAVTAVKAWVFEPAVDFGQRVPACLDVPFEFDATKPEGKKPGLLPPPHLRPRDPPRVAAETKSTPIGDYPESLRARKLPGRLVFECEVTPEGRADGLRVLGASHADFVQAALAASPGWEFQPAMRGDLPVRAELRGEVALDLAHASLDVILVANGITAPDGSAPENLPRPEVVADPVWPHAALLKGEGGAASVEFTVRFNGALTDVKVRDATTPEFGRALVAALEMCSFGAALQRGRGVDVTLVRRVEFKPPPATDPLGRLVALARTETIGGGAGLDEKLTPLYRVAPVYPEALSAAGKPAGQAAIEFVIDRDGRARLPRIVSASHEEFGWAAATAVAQWVFRAPRRGGAPTDVKVQIPFNFSPP